MAALSVLRVVLLLAADQRRSEGKGAVQEDPRARLHRRRERQKDVKVYRERSQPRSGKGLKFLSRADWKSQVRTCLGFCTADWPMNQLNKNPNIALLETSHQICNFVINLRISSFYIVLRGLLHKIVRFGRCTNLRGCYVYTSKFCYTKRTYLQIRTYL